VSLLIILGHIETAKNDHLRLAFGREGCSSGGRVGTTEITTLSSRLDAREVVAVADGQNDKKKTPPGSRLNAREVVVAGGRNGRRTTSSSRLDAREVMMVAQAVETTKKNTSSSRLTAREVVVVANVSKRSKKTTSGSRLNAREVVVGVALERQK
jgi:hypothetical protein